MKHLVFTVKDEKFAIDIMRIVEILNPVDVHTIPDLPPFIDGVINLRGNIIPIINLRKRFDIDEPSEKARIIIIRFDNESVGLLVDSVVEIKELETEQISRPSRLFRGFRAEFIKGIANPGKEDVIIIMDIDKVLTTEEIVKLKESSKQLEKDLLDDRG
ncbi:MAG TPA: purine-binding chemotaxis protein CheW [Nitrospirae bacterium]|nr:purine-binding chemotaxis protein CheW [Nitrospirota bacterium]